MLTVVLDFNRHGLTNIYAKNIIEEALGKELVRRFDLGEDVLPIRTREMCEAETRMANLPAKYGWLQEENTLLASEMETLRAKLRSVSSRVDSDMAAIAELQDEMEKDSGSAKERHECEECGTLF
jgi:peptidoglycan hydrolase CwlO-like protein